MDIEYLLKFYSANNPDSEKPRTHISDILSKTSSLLEWCSKSNNRSLDYYSESAYNIYYLYEISEKNSELDNSEIYKIKEKIPSLFIDKLVDIFICLIKFISANRWNTLFMTKLHERVLEEGLNNKLDNIIYEK